MSDANQQLSRICETYAGYLALGNELRATDAASFVSNVSRSDIYDDNHLSLLRVAEPDAIEALLRDADVHFAQLGHQYFIVDALTPAPLEARLVQRGLRYSAEVELLLEGALAPVREVAGLEIRLADGDADWETIARLALLEEVEEAKKFSRESMSEAITRALVDDRRAKGPAVRTWLARHEGVDCAYFGSWPGENGVGKVEDLFTHPDARHRGIASALIAHSVADARSRCADAVMIGALPEDTPRLMYETLGFRPCCVMRGYLQAKTR